jgi:hypothetical protein
MIQLTRLAGKKLRFGYIVFPGILNMSSANLSLITTSNGIMNHESLGNDTPTAAYFGRAKEV